MSITGIIIAAAIVGGTGLFIGVFLGFAGTKFAVEVQQDVRKTFKDKVYATGIPRNIRIVEASAKGKSVIEFDIQATGAKAYLEVAKEVMACE